MQSSGDEAFDDFQIEFMAYLEGRLGLKREEATALLSEWLVHHPHRGRPGLKKTLPEPELASDRATSFASKLR